MSFSLSYDGNVIELGESSSFIGRSASCKIMLDGPLVSRRHAQLVVTGDRLTVKDLGSANGVIVNGRRIRGDQRLKDGDRIRIGEHELEVKFTPGAAACAVSAAPTPLASLWDDDEDPFEDGQETVLLDGAHVLGPIDPLLDAGKVADAEQMAQARMRGALGQASTGRMDAARCKTAARQALRLASATRKPQWLDFAFDLYLASGELLAPSLLDELARALTTIDSTRVEAYIDALRSRDELAGSERVLARLEAMARHMKTRSRPRSER